MIGKQSLFDQRLTRAKLSQMEEGLWMAWQAVSSAAQLADQSEPCKVQVKCCATEDLFLPMPLSKFATSPWNFFERAA